MGVVLAGAILRFRGRGRMVKYLSGGGVSSRESVSLGLEGLVREVNTGWLAFLLACRFDDPVPPVSFEEI